MDGADSSVENGWNCGIDKEGGFGVGGFGSNMCSLIDVILDRRDMYISFSIDDHCIPHRAPLTHQLLKVTNSHFKLTQIFHDQDFERQVDERVESRIDERCWCCGLEVGVGGEDFSCKCEITTGSAAEEGTISDKDNDNNDNIQRNINDDDSHEEHDEEVGSESEDRRGIGRPRGGGVGKSICASHNVVPSCKKSSFYVERSS